MDRFLRLLLCACGAAVIAGGLWLLMATNIVPDGGYDQNAPEKPPEVDYIDPSSLPRS